MSPLTYLEQLDLLNMGTHFIVIICPIAPMSSFVNGGPLFEWEVNCGESIFSNTLVICTNHYYMGGTCLLPWPELSFGFRQKVTSPPCIIDVYVRNGAKGAHYLI